MTSLLNVKKNNNNELNHVLLIFKVEAVNIFQVWPHNCIYPYPISSFIDDDSKHKN